MRLEIDIAEHHYNNIMALDSVSLGRVPYKGIIMYSINAIKHGKVLEQESTIKNDLPHCQLTDEEIAKSFIEDVEAVKDQLPCGEQMDFPNTFDDFVKDYGFKDKDEVYTNGSELITVFRVKQWLEHISTTKNDLPKYCDRNICLKNEYNNIGCDDCEVTKSQEQTTKNDLGVDAVSRKAVNGYIDYILSHGMGKKKSFDFIKKFVTNLPSVTPQEPRWIPVSEKKPNEGGEYLLWGKIDESEEENYCFIGDYHEFDEVFGTEISNYDPTTLGFIDTEIEEYYSVVAWMPLPKPYKAESEDK